MSQYLAVTFTDTLMRLIDDIYIQSGDRVSLYYFRVPDDWTGPDLQAKVFAIAEKMYNEFNAQFRAEGAIIAEPTDPNYIKVLKTDAVPMQPQQVATKLWLTADSPAAWEWTPCIIVNDDGTYEPVDPENF